LASAGKNSFNAAAVAANSMDSVVEITTESMSRGNSIMGQFVSKGAGSGVIISADGYIATNNHVVANANKVTVRTRDGKEYKAKIIGTDERTDLAVIKIEAKGLNAAQYGTSKDIIVGQPVVAIGNPLGELGGTVTDGIISALDREVEVEEQKMTLLQTSAAVNPGNSGGGLFDGDGKLIGIVNAKSSGSGVEGLGFAIPIDTARGVIEQITKNGYVTGRVDIGMNFMDVDEQAAYMYRLSEPGVYIKEIVRGSYAEQAGLMPGDRVITVDGKKIESSDEVENIITAHKVGDKVDFRVERGAKQKTVSLTLAEEKPASPSLF
ncbi:MAG: trypsin-like peptidase domain-containing protein, partial [Clostridia bacterium]